jgi:hypothetical protein
VKRAFSVDILWPTVAVEFITAAFHCVYILQLLNRPFERFVRRWIVNTSSINSLRWVEYAITATMMMEFGSISMQINDVYYFIRSVSSGIALQFCGYCIELLDHKDERDRSLYRILWWVIGFSINISGVIVLLMQTFGSSLGNAFWYFVENTVPFALWFNTFGIVASFTYERRRQFVDAYFSEKYYIILSLSTKIAVFWLSYGTYRQIMEGNGVVGRTPNVDWFAVRLCAMLIPALWLIGYVAYDMIEWSKRFRWSKSEKTWKSRY